MTIFKRKNYTIQEGHYTGPKQKAPTSIGKTSMIMGGSGAVFGGIKSYLDGDPEMSTLENVFEGVTDGFSWGSLGGLALGAINKHIEKPLTEIQYEKLDNAIRMKFGNFRIPLVDIGVGYNKKFRDNFNEYIRYNDRNITNYKINFGIKRNQITMYTLGLSDNELNKVSRILDDMTRNNPYMAYHSSLLNQKVNSYAVYITFNSYNNIAEFMVEVAKDLETPVNILDKGIYLEARTDSFKNYEVDRTTGDRQSNSGTEIASADNSTVVKVITPNNPALKDAESNIDEEKRFSLIDTAHTALDFIKDSGHSLMDIVKSVKNRISVNSLSAGMCAAMKQVVQTQQVEQLKAITGLPAARKGYSNDYLTTILTKNHYVKGFHYTVGEKKSNANMSLDKSILLITADKGPISEKIDKEFYNSDRKNIGRAEIDKVVTYVHCMHSIENFSFLIKKLMSTGITFNII